MSRSWLKARLDNAGGVTALVPKLRIFAAGSLDTNAPVRPFILIKEGSTVRGPYPGATVTQPSIWVHDDPGSYLLIDEILAEIRKALVGQVVEVGGITCLWLGDSGELADEGYKTITRNSSYQINRKEGTE